MISRKGEISTANYDHLGRKTSLSIPNMGTYSYEYNIMGQAVKVSHGSEAIRYIYDDLGRVVRETDGAGRHMDYAYNDAAGTWDIKYNVTNSSHYWLRYATDDAGRLSSIKEYGTNTLATYRYDTLSRVKSVAFGNGTVKNVTYEASGQLKSLKHNFTGTADDATWLYGRNNNGQVTSKSISNAGYKWTPSFTSNTLYSANALNQYYNIGGIEQKHDKNGNLIQDGSMSFIFNALGQMTEAKSGGMIVGKYEYDPLGRRKAKTAGGLKTEYLWSGNQVMAEYRGGRLLRRYIYGAGIDNPIALISGNGTKTYIHKDALGSVVALSNNAGVVTDKFSYSPFGKSADESGSPYKFAARRIDSETGLYYNRNRYYNPSTGRFISPDPIGYGDGMNMYAYVGNDPMNATDPMGLFANDDDDVLEEIIVEGKRIKPMNEDWIVKISGDALRRWIEQELSEYLENFLINEKKKVLNYGKDNCTSNANQISGEITDISGEISNLSYHGITMREPKNFVNAVIYEIYSDHQFKVSGMVNITLGCHSTNICTGAVNNWSYTVNAYVKSHKVSIPRKSSVFPYPFNTPTNGILIADKAIQLLKGFNKSSKYYKELMIAGKMIVSSPNFTCKATQPTKK